MPVTSHAETQCLRILYSVYLFEGSHFYTVSTQNAHVEHYYRLAQVNDKSLNGYHGSNLVSYILVLGHTDLEQHVVINQRMFKELDLSECLKKSLVY